MKIAILTLPLHTNYGGILQAYALQTVLEHMGHDVSVLNSPPYKAYSNWMLPLAYSKRFFDKIILRKDVSILYDRDRRTRQYTDKFIKKYIHTYFVYEWLRLEDKFDMYVVGSDQIWRPKYAKMFSGIPNAFLEFTEKWEVKRMAYAASFGTKDWEFTKDQESLCKRLIQSFENISVRESSGVTLCKKHFNVMAEHVLDPTLLLSESSYNMLIRDVKTEPCKGNLMCYILDSTKFSSQVINDVENRLGLKSFQTNSRIGQPGASPKERIQPPVEQWLRSFKDAEFVITDSFHACVFSIIYKKPFLVLSNESRGNARIESLLKMFGLENRLVSEKDCLREHSICPIDYANVYEILNKMRSQSRGFIERSLFL